MYKTRHFYKYHNINVIGVFIVKLDKINPI